MGKENFVRGRGGSKALFEFESALRRAENLFDNVRELDLGGKLTQYMNLMFLLVLAALTGLTAWGLRDYLNGRFFLGQRQEDFPVALDEFQHGQPLQNMPGAKEGQVESLGMRMHEGRQENRYSEENHYRAA